MAAPQGPKAWMDWGNRVEKRIVQITPISGLNTTVDDSPTGNGRTVNAQAGGDGVSSRPADFSLYDATGNHASAGGLWVGVRIGNANPSNIAFASGVTSRPDNYTETNNYIYEFAVTASGRAWIELTITAPSGTTPATITGNTVKQGTALPTTSATLGVIPLGNWTVTSPSGTPTLTIVTGKNGIGSQSFLYCAGVVYPWSA